MFKLVCFLFCAQLLVGESIPRTVIALYNLKADEEMRLSRLHQVAEMPLNHLGVKLHYVDVRSPLPDLSNAPDVIGVISWFDQESDLSVGEVERLLNWSIKALEGGKLFLHLGESPFESTKLEYPLPREEEFWKLMGLKNMNDYVAGASLSELAVDDPTLFDFETSFPKLLPGFNRVVPVGEGIDCLLGITPKGNEARYSCLVAVTPSGAFANSDFLIRYLYEHGKLQRSWYINPFRFFEKALKLEGTPRPDTTTVDGRRIFYSQIDGDGWNNETEIRGYEWGTISARVLREKILEAYPTLPVTVAPIGADIDPHWVGKESSIEEAKKIFLLPHIQVGNHTFTHPFDWSFFEHYTPQKELPYLSYYPNGSWLGRGWIAKIRSFFQEEDPNAIEQEKKQFSSYLNSDYDVPRAFALQPFDLEMEVKGSTEVIEALAKRRAGLYQWSGDCNPFYAAVRLVKEAHLANINGGDTRFDQQYPSYAYVAPIGREVEDLWQIYASNSNENTYTNLWSSEFWGFNKLTQTFYNTEVPIRVKPMDLYYHVYSLQKEASYHALVGNIDYILRHPHMRMTAEEFTEIATGFYSVRIEKVGDGWRIKERGALSTIRFDQASDKKIDFAKSKGVIGYRHLQGSLYVHLDPEEKEPTLFLVDRENGESMPYLIESSWRVVSFKRLNGGITLKVKGYGPFEMRLFAPGLKEAVIVGEEGLFSREGSEINIVRQKEEVGELVVNVR